MNDSLHHLIMHFNFISRFPDDSQIMQVSYDYSLVVISYFIAAITGYTGLSIAKCIQERKSLKVHSKNLLILGSFSMGLGIWAMHFIAMLAYSINVEIYYDLTITAFSVLPAILASWVMLTAMSRKKPTFFSLILQGLIIGVGIGLMHYIGMGAMIHQAIPAYHIGLAILAIVVAWVLGIFTLYIHFSVFLNKFLSKFRADLIVSSLWGGAVSAMHYTGMSAVIFMPTSTAILPEGVASQALITPVAVVSIILIFSAFAFSQFQQRLLSVSIDAEKHREQLTEAMEEMNDGFIVTDANNIITIVNKKMLEIIPNIRGKLQVGSSIEPFIDWLINENIQEKEEGSKNQKLFDSFLSVKNFKRSMEFSLKNEQWLMVRQSISKSGLIMRSWTDTTTYKKAEATVFQEQTMESMGRMVAGVAHEVNTPLGICLTLASHLDEDAQDIRHKYDNNSVSQKDFEKYLKSTEKVSGIMLANIRRAADLIQNFKQVAVDQTHLEVDNICLKEYVEQIFKTLHSEYKALNPIININAPHDLRIKTTPGAFSQVIINLINNSVLHAFDTIKNPTITVNIKATQKHVIIEYIDNGLGMSQEVLDKIFEPFFTTKRQKGGTGLGMHIVFNIVNQQLKGNIKVESSLNNGSCFTITLPHSSSDI